MTNREAWEQFGYPSTGWSRPHNGWKTSTQWKVIENDTEMHIGFQYSKGKLDWLFNLLFPAIGGIHLGMRLKLRSTWRDIHNRIYRANVTGKKVYLWGHSQGGGFAHVVKYYMERQGLTVERSTSWGEPRVFSWFAKTPADLISFEYCSDIVPHLPPFILGFKSVGRIKLGTIRRSIYDSHTCYGEFME